MKRQFGSLLASSFLGRGATLTEVEHTLSEELIRRLPISLKVIVETQIEAYNLVQREVDGRALNFYRMRSGRAAPMDELPQLEMDVEEAPLMRITASVAEDSQPVHATLSAVSGRVFCVAFNRRVDGYPPGTTVRVTSHKDAWRSNFRTEIKQGEQFAAENLP